jgi:hypothetical protein
MKRDQQKRNETKSTKRNQRNETKPTKAKRNQQKYDIWTSESLSASKPNLDWVAGNVREEYCNGQTCKMGFPVIINQNYCI